MLEEKCYNLQEEITTLFRNKSSTAEELVKKNEKVVTLEKELQKLSEENELHKKRLDGFKERDYL